MGIHSAVTMLSVAAAALGIYLACYETGSARWIGLAVLITALASVVLCLIKARRERSKIAALHDQLIDFLEGRIDSPRFSVDDDNFALFENAVVELESRLLLEREKAQRESVKNAEFIADVSHQLKTPLAALKLYCEMEEAACQGDWVPVTHRDECLPDTDPQLGERAPVIPKKEELASRWDFCQRGEVPLASPARKELGFSSKKETNFPSEYAAKQLILIERMEQLIKSLLRLEKLRADTYEMYFETHDLSALIMQVWNELQPLYPHKTFQLTGCAAMHCDAHWIGEALQNILKNSCEHTPLGGQIRAGIETMEHSIIVTIEDDGGGIPEKELLGLFQRFHRISRLRPDGGVGLGLAIARTIIEKHHGLITAENTTGGLRIALCFPRMDGILKTASGIHYAGRNGENRD